jgi:hypothetical protein
VLPAPGHVHDPRLAQDRDGFVDVADLEQNVHRRGEIALQDDAGAADRLEAGDREGDVIGARAEIDDALLAGAVGDGAAHALDLDRRRRIGSPLLKATTT